MPTQSQFKSRGVLIALAGILSTLLLGACGRQVSNLSAEAIRQVRVGMSVQEVEAILGKPLEVRTGSVGHTIHDYAFPRVSGPSMWISFEGDRVSVVHVKLHKLLGEDRAIYEEAAHHPRFETPEFEASFRRR